MPDQSSPSSDQPQRRAIVHTVDVSEKYSEHAKKIVYGFRQALYEKDIIFNVANVSDWLDQQMRERQLDNSEDKAFLHHVILDMPSSYQHMTKASTTLRSNGSLLLFSPSITQITAAVDLVRMEKLPLFLERVVELGPSLTGGKEWDVRAVKPRALLLAEQEGKQTSKMELKGREPSLEHPETTSTQQSVDMISRGGEQSQAAIGGGQGLEMICRPKPFARLLGGGFLGVWRKKLSGRQS